MLKALCNFLFPVRTRRTSTIEKRCSTNVGKARCQIDNMVFYSTGHLHIKQTNKDGKVEIFVNDKPLSEGLPDGVTMERT